ncbi:MAG: hypothetical protein ABWX82_07640, partial [Leifsonia sp.]
MPSIMARISHLVLGRRNPSNVSEALRNAGQLNLNGTLAASLPFQNEANETAILDLQLLPWELRQETWLQAFCANGRHPTPASV